MAKRRRSFDRRPEAARPGQRGEGRASARAAEAAGATRRRNTVLYATIGLTAAIIILALVSGLPGPADPSPSSSPTPVPSPAVTVPSVPSTGLSPMPSPTTGGTAPVISGVACDVDEKTTYHVHSHLNIRFDGELQPVPADIGILDNCLYWLHTHSNHGVIHVEAPSEMALTLGQFFDIWGQPLEADRVLERTVGPGETLFVFVDRQPVEGDPRSIELGDLVAIELQIGTEPLEPLPYTFPPDLE